MSVNDTRELYELRAALEGLAGGLFAERATPADVLALKRALSDARETKGAELSVRLAAKDRFYDALFTGAHNEMIRSTLRGIHARVQLLRGLSMSTPGRHEAAIRELQAITDAAAVKRDPAQARQACERHVQKAGALAVAALGERLSSTA